jgi:tRNA U34 5-methylaminomethyl-2-thiouridine-forming methyltransferase MnmC
VFINAGLKHVSKKSVSVLEVGFGTGLNALLTCLEAQKGGRYVDYTAIELYPLEDLILEELAYNISPSGNSSIFRSLHASAWEERVAISPGFFLTKINADLITSRIGDNYDLVYFDAFSPAVQPELWSEVVFQKIYSAMTDGGILTTYCAKGSVRRAMQKAGFIVERLPGPPPKREMLRGEK